MKIHHVECVIHTERITQNDKEMIYDLDYKGIEFLVWKKDVSKIGMKNKICIMFFVIKTNWLIPFMYQIKNLKIRPGVLNINKIANLSIHEKPKILEGYSESSWISKMELFVKIVDG